MPSASPKLVTTMLVIAISVAMLVSLGQARVQPQAQTDVQAPVQFALPDPLRCWASIRKTRGCSNEVEDLILSGEIISATAISPICCTVLADLGQNCWSKLFPLNPLLPAALGSYCAAVNNGGVDIAPGPTESDAELTVVANGGVDVAPEHAESGEEMGSDSVAKFFFWGA
ncbi:hypothetical protein RHSIM_Rhsim01G0055100 [Rhododendron simsii]|uniref:Prolamin-like domain-containing protein n=1 Tax=Rhododendron simsii TaxID=118357 RepID=A0A834HFX9_RHOSS|nr:hypothetical protein RHSIM_Rhsim01G0055100 [Rhododendron simsii]